MASSLFTTERAGSPVRSEKGDEVPQVAPRGGGRVGGSRGIIQAEAPTRVMHGRGPVTTGLRKFRYDVLKGSTARMNVVVTRDSVMSDDEAANFLHRIHTIYGVEGQSDEFLFCFDRGLFRCYTLNSGSVLVPGRAVIIVENSNPFPYATVRDVLGEGLRRFGRAFADEIRAENKRIIEEFDPYDADKSQAFYALQQVAQSRGTSRMMELSHDSAIYCTGLSPHEYTVLTSAANSVISANTNSADRMRNNDRVQSAEGYDSTTQTMLGGAMRNR